MSSSAHFSTAVLVVKCLPESSCSILLRVFSNSFLLIGVTKVGGMEGRDGLSAPGCCMGIPSMLHEHVTVSAWWSRAPPGWWVLSVPRVSEGPLGLGR